ncbi:MAG: RICIN domain-containing protein [Coriobacteriales bacterium]
MRSGTLFHRFGSLALAALLAFAFMPLAPMQQARGQSSYTLMAGTSSFTTAGIMRIVPKSYPGPWQCQGYARWLGAQLTGVDPCGPSLDGIGNKVKPSAGWTMYTSIDSAGGLQVGDFIRIKTQKYGHAAIITSVGTGANPVIQVTEKWNDDPTIHNGDLMGTSTLRTQNQIKSHGIHYVLRWHGHVHDYKTVASAVCTGYNTHSITKRCSCGATVKTAGTCEFKTSGSKRVCATCGAEARPFGSNTPVSLPEGYYFIRASANEGFGLDVAKGSSATGANLQLYKRNKTKAQQFLIKKNSNGTYALVSRIGSDRLVGVAGWSTKNSANVLMKGYNRVNRDKQWIIERTPDGYYSFRNKYSNLYLDLKGGGAPRKGQNVQQYKGNGTAAQKFTLTRVSIADATITGVVDKPYTGKGTIQRPKVVVGNRTLKLGRDYYFAYKNNVNVGKATVIVKGRGDFCGSASRLYNVVRSR